MTGVAQMLNIFWLKYPLPTLTKQSVHTGDSIDFGDMPAWAQVQSPPLINCIII